MNISPKLATVIDECVAKNLFDNTRSQWLKRAIVEKILREEGLDDISQINSALSLRERNQKLEEIGLKKIER